MSERRSTLAFLQPPTLLELERTIWRLHGELKEVKRLRNEPKHAFNCAARVNGECTCDYKSTFGT